MNETPEIATAAPAADAAATIQQAADTTGATVETVAAEGTAAATPAPQPQQGGFGMFVPILLIFAIFYFMMIRPQQRKEKERRKMIDELRAGKKIIFAGGIIGTIVEASEKTFIVETEPGTKMEILRSSVQGSAE